MNKVLLGLLLGAILGAIDGMTAWFTPAGGGGLEYLDLSLQNSGLQHQAARVHKAPKWSPEPRPFLEGIKGRVGGSQHPETDVVL